MELLVLFAFFGGIVTILSPCILPILPIVLSGSVGDGRRRPWGIVAGFVFSFTFFTLFLTTLVNVLNISADILRQVAVVVLLVFGLSLLIPRLQAWLEQYLTRLTPRRSGPASNGFGGGFVLGCSLGLVWTPCVGPILASVISLALTGSVNGGALIITLAYSLGTALPMLAIIYGGRQLLQKVPGLMRQTALIQKIFGVIMIVTALAIFFSWDRGFQSFILEKFPSYGSGLTSFEDNTAVKQELDKLSAAPTNMINKNEVPIEEHGQPAPELISGGEWLNSEPLSLAELRGKVVLLDFMTYSCINCIRTFPYLNDWHEKYSDEGLVIIGIHTPEFEFEKDPENVSRALKDFGITFPVMQDNDYATWRAYGNRYWPRKYLLNIDGEIVYDHIGEGEYKETEMVIQELLRERQQRVGQAKALPAVDRSAEPVIAAASPETYFGSARNQYLANGRPGVSGEQDLSVSADIDQNRLYLGGRWDIEPEYSLNLDNEATIVYRYAAAHVYMVASAEQPTDVIVFVDGEEERTVTVEADKLYELVSHQQAEAHTLELRIQSGGLKAFTFTFG